MDGTTLQARIYSGYAKAALRIGLPYTHFRPIGADLPLDVSNNIGSLTASFNAQDWSYLKANKYGNPLWYCVADGSQLVVGDYLQNAQNTYFIAAMQSILPILAVQTNAIVNVMRPHQQLGVGQLGYGADTSTTEDFVMTGWPISILKGSKGDRGDMALPGDTRSPWFQALMPAIPAVNIQNADILVDTDGNRYIVSMAELTDLGWRLSVAQAVA